MVGNEGFGRSSDRDPPLLIEWECHPRHSQGSIRILIPQNSKSIKIKNPPYSGGSFDFYLVGNEGFFFSATLWKTPCHKKPNSIGFFPHSFVVSMTTVSNPNITSIFLKTPFLSKESFKKLYGWEWGIRTPDAGFRVRSLTTWRIPSIRRYAFGGGADSSVLTRCHLTKLSIRASDCIERRPFCKFILYVYSFLHSAYCKKPIFL